MAAGHRRRTLASLKPCAGLIPGQSVPCLVFLLFLLPGCRNDGKRQPLPSLPERAPACAEVSLLQDMALTGSFIKNTITCAAGTTPDEGAGAVLDLLAALDEDGIDQLIAFLLRPGRDPQSPYPWLDLMTMVLERGVTGPDGVVDDDAAAIRFGPLQELLLQVRPYRAAALVLDWNRTGRLTPMVEHLRDFLDTLPGDSFGAGVRGFLSEEALRRDLITAADAVLQQPAVARPVTDLFTLEPSVALRPADRGHCLGLWSDPLPRSNRPVDDRCLPETAYPGEAATGGDRLTAYARAEGPVPAALLRAALLRLAPPPGAGPLEIRRHAHLYERLGNGLREAMRTTATPLHSGLALLHQALSLQGGDLQGLQKFLRDVFRDPELRPLLALALEKPGGTLLQEELIRTMGRGTSAVCYDADGRPGTTGDLPPLFTEELSRDRAALDRALNQWLQPVARCNGMPPLLAVVIATVCAQPAENAGTCSAGFHQQYADLPAMQTAFAGTLLTADSAGGEPSPDLQRRLIRLLLRETGARLAENPWYLAEAGVTTGRLEVSTPAWQSFATGVAKLLNTDHLNAAAVAAFDRACADDQELQRLFRPGPLARLINHRLAGLTSAAARFPDLMAADDNNKVLHFLAGLYPEGPVHGFLRANLAPRGPNAAVLDGLRRQLLAGDGEPGSPVMARVLHTFRHPDRAFRLPGVPLLSTDLTYHQPKDMSSWLSGTARGAGLIFTGPDLQPQYDSGQAPGMDRLFREDAASSGATTLGAWRWTRHMDAGESLSGKDFVNNLAGSDVPALAWTDWYRGTLVPWLSGPEGLRRSPVPAPAVTLQDWCFIFSDNGTCPGTTGSGAYSPADLRIITHFLLQNFYSDAVTLPGERQVRANKGGREPVLRLTGSAGLRDRATGRRGWPLFRDLYPQSLLDPAVDSLPAVSAVFSRTLQAEAPPLLTLAAPARFTCGSLTLAPGPEQTAGELFNGEDLRLLASLNLMTCDKSGPDRNKPGAALHPVRPDGKMSGAGIYSGTPDDYAAGIAAIWSQRFCPVLGRDGPFPDDLRRALQLRLGLAGDDSLICDNGRGSFGPDGVPPQWIAGVLRDLLVMGRRPAPGPLWARYPAALARAAATEQNHGPAPAVQAVLKAPVLYHAGTVSAWQASRRVYPALGAGTDSLMGQFLALARTPDGTDSNALFLSHAMAMYGTVAPGQKNPDPSLTGGGYLTELAEMMICAIGDDADHCPDAAPAADLTEVLLRVLHQAEPRHLRVLAALITDQGRLEMLRLQGIVTPIIGGYVDQLEGDRSLWQDPGFALLRQLIRRENLDTIHALLGDFDTGEVVAALLFVREQLDEHFGKGQIREQAAFVHRTAEFLFRATTGSRDGAPTTTGLNQLLVDLAFSGPDRDGRLSQALARLGADWLHTRLTGFDGTPAPAAADTLGPLLTFALEQGPAVLAAWQLEATPTEQEFSGPSGFFTAMLGDLLHPFRQDTPATATAALALRELLEHPAAGMTQQPPLLSTLLHPEPEGDPWPVLSTVSRADRQIWSAALQSSTRTLPDLHPFIRFFHRKAEFSVAPAEAASWQAGLGALERLSGPRSDWLQQQVHVASGWLNRLPGAGDISENHNEQRSF